MAVCIQGECRLEVSLWIKTKQLWSFAFHSLLASSTFHLPSSFVFLQCWSDQNWTFEISRRIIWVQGQL